MVRQGNGLELQLLIHKPAWPLWERWWLDGVVGAAGQREIQRDCCSLGAQVGELGGGVVSRDVSAQQTELE